MRYSVVALVVIALLATASCSSFGPSGPHASGAKAGAYRLIRIAVNEYRFSDPAQCKDAAQLYYHNSYPSDPTGGPTLVGATPLVYSMKAKDVDIEVRFVVVSPDDLNRNGKLINYWEVNRKQKDNDKKDIDDAIDEFQRRFGDEVIVGPFQDPTDVNGTRPWRAVLKKKKISPPQQFAMYAADDDTYGMIINPPYPR